MSLDSILSQVTGGVSWQALTLSTILRGALTLIIGIIVVKILMKLVDRALNRSKAVVAVRGYIRSTVRVLLWSILAVMVLSLLYPASGAYTPVSIPEVPDSRALWKLFEEGLPEYIAEVALCLAPIAAFFVVFQVVSLKLKKKKVLKKI